MTALNKQALREAAEKATPGRIGDRIDGSNSIKYECHGYDGSLVLRTDHKNMEYGFIGDNSNADELFFRLCVPDVVLALLDELESAERQNGYLREQRDEWERKAISNFEECAEMSTRIEELESQRKLAFTASNRWADKFREAEKRIAELEAKIETADKLQDSAFRHGLQHGFSYGQANDQAGYEQCLKSYSSRGKDNG